MNDVVIENAFPLIAGIRIGVDPGSSAGVKVKVMEEDGTLLVEDPIVLGRGHSTMGTLHGTRRIELTIVPLEAATIKGDYEVVDEEKSPLIEAPDPATEPANDEPKIIL